MTVVIFVHGIGGRQENYDITYQKIKQIIQHEKPSAEVKPCLWGDDYGAKLLAGGASIPNYRETGGEEDSKEEKFLERRWNELYQDPFWEIRLLGYREDTKRSPFNDPRKIVETRIQEFLEELNSEKFLKKIEKYRITRFLKEACKIIINSSSFDRWIQTVSPPLEEEYAAFSRAIVSVVIKWLSELNIYAPIISNSKIREEVINVILRKLTNDTQSRALGIKCISKFLEDKSTSLQVFLGAASGLITDKNITPYVRKRRGAISDFTYPIAGDILVYQNSERGKQIRQFIERQIRSQQEPVILLAHSLGGVACVEMLAEKLKEGDDLSQVKLLITVGSQAPFFYELNALKGFPFEEGKPLPKAFPQWLNIYDLSDILSYVGKKLFPNQVKDVEVGNKKPLFNSNLLNSHVGYWENENTWKAIFETWSTIPELK